jgi:hypothetical protein
MAYNPPDTKREIRDTLFCLGIPKQEARLDTDRGHIWHFRLTEARVDIDIYSPRFLRYNKKRYHSAHELKLALIQDYRHVI